MFRRRGPTTSSECGQALVEFALVLPAFLLLVFGVVEFGLAFNAAVSVNFVSRAAALLAAEGGRSEGTDCMVLRAIEQDMTSPASPTRISSVEIYWSDSNGDQISSNVNVYTRSGSLTCTYASGSITVPYTLGTERYPETERCDVLAGCGGLHTTVDDVGVRITYTHQWVTYVGKTIAGSITFQRSTAARMEPTL
jgi:Flp pilus assembly protein TadG